MKKAIIKTHYLAQENPEKFPRKYEHNIQPSLTIPDQTMTVKEILIRHTQGLGYGSTLGVPMYYGDTEMYDQSELAKLDISERIELLEANKERLNEMRQKMIKEHQDKQLEQFRKQVVKEHTTKNLPAPPSGAEPRKNDPDGTN